MNDKAEIIIVKIDIDEEQAYKELSKLYDKQLKVLNKIRNKHGQGDYSPKNPKDVYIRHQIDKLRTKEISLSNPFMKKLEKVEGLVWGLVGMSTPEQFYGIIGKFSNPQDAYDAGCKWLSGKMMPMAPCFNTIGKSEEEMAEIVNNNNEFIDLDNLAGIVGNYTFYHCWLKPILPGEEE